MYNYGNRCGQGSCPKIHRACIAGVPPSAMLTSDRAARRGLQVVTKRLRGVCVANIGARYAVSIRNSPCKPHPDSQVDMPALPCMLRLLAPLSAPLTTLAAAHLAHAQAPPATAQPIPIEFMAGTRYASANVVLSRNLSPGSRFGFFHLNTIVMGYGNEAADDLAMQNLLFVEPIARIRFTGGLAYATRAGLSPTVGVQYVNAGRGRLLLLPPRLHVEEEPSYSVFTILRYTWGLTDRLGLYTSLQALNTFDADRHIKSYQWTRLGLEMGRTQFGLAVNFDESGPNPDIKASVGLFVRREVF